MGPGRTAPCPAPSVSPRPEAPPSITLQGKVLSEQDEPLPGAYVKVAGTIQGTVVQLDGSFRLTLLKPPDPFTLEVSFVGYEIQSLSLRLQEVDKPLTIRLRETGVRAQEVVISASRVSETVMESPVTVLKMSAREIGEAPGINFFQNITFLKGVEQVSSSLTFQVINTRGFNSTTNPRFA
ncbi:MAG: carboxypeptidase-like regulatory domain-containing protein [Bacteroidia bacterium]|nr:carboxypeptidase-like regulatory domain-containing protein [Bacteroidia bacterium]MDW8088320.1 carboxypeptidase-like regulatory domain-containing protein [Bacteroidia bacterium]